MSRIEQLISEIEEYIDSCKSPGAVQKQDHCEQRGDGGAFGRASYADPG